jgi:hypothetical protein
MFGWTGFKYRNQVIVDIHSILFFVPELKKLLETFPQLRQAAGDLKKAGKTELESAAYLSVVVLESVLEHVPEDGRNEALAQLARYEKDRFRWFRDQLSDETGTPKKATLTEMLPLTFALGFALWYLAHEVSQNRLGENSYREFLTSVARMLRSKTAG